MNPETNDFYEAVEPMQESHIPFTIGEEIPIKGHIFKIKRINLVPRELVLVPVRKSAEEKGAL